MFPWIPMALKGAYRVIGWAAGQEAVRKGRRVMKITQQQLLLSNDSHLIIDCANFFLH
jgi:hypothetical protein